MDVPAVFATVPRAVWYSVAPFAFVALALSLVRVYTTWNYHRTVKELLTTPIDSKPSKKTLTPPQIPYALPFLGNSFDFLNTKPGQYWDNLFSWHPRSTGACTLLLGGRKTHIIYTPSAVQAMFKASRTLKRDQMEHDLFSKVFMMPDDQIANAEAGKHMEIEMNAQYLTKYERVNELTSKFTEVLDEVLSKDAEEIANKDSTFLYEWLRDRMFTASATALMGSKLLEIYPSYGEDFFKFDQEFLMFYFGLPSFVLGDAIPRRKRIIDKLQAWSKAMHEESGGQPIDPEGPAWEPLFGSRLNRARQIDYKNRKLNAQSGAALDLGITFGLASNAIPATGWMLFHILSDKSVYTRIMGDLRTAEKADGSIDVPTLVSLPLLQSIWTETLRLYVDALVTRNVEADTTLPLDLDGRTNVQLKKGEQVFAPCWLGHHDPSTWPTDSKDSAPVDQFCAERFLINNPDKPDDVTFSLTGTANSGKFFPFGGGRTICPGRVFAKQEALGALAMVLLRFEFQVLSFVDKDKKETDQVPGPATAFPGSGALVPGGDMRVKIKKSKRKS